MSLITNSNRSITVSEVDTFSFTGDTGAGKSTTINNLMNNEMIKTSGKKSETRSVTEYIRKCNVGKLQLSGLEVDIVDTPGFGDTEGLPQDACNLWAIQRFCAETIKAYPNIIVVCMKATENRFEGAKSNFVKCLKILQAMHIIDKEKVNVVIVLTHACALPRRKQRWIEKSSDLANNIKDVLKKELGFSVRVAYIENSIDDYDLDLMDQGSLLPDGTLQPQNLFWVIRDQLKDNGDDLGYLTFEQVYSERMTGKPFLVGNSIDAKIAKDHQDNLDQEENQCLLILQDVAGASDAFKKLKAQFDKVIFLTKTFIKNRMTLEKKTHTKGIETFLVTDEHNFGKHILGFSKKSYDKKEFSVLLVKKNIFLAMSKSFVGGSFGISKRFKIFGYSGTSW